MRHGLFTFLRGESGAVSADWVVLTAGAAVLAAMTIVLVTQRTTPIGGIISASVQVVDGTDGPEASAPIGR